MYIKNEMIFKKKLSKYFAMVTLTIFSIKFLKTQLGNKIFLNCKLYFFILNEIYNFEIKFTQNRN